MATIKTMASTANKRAREKEEKRLTIVKSIWNHAPEGLKRTTKSAIVVGMAAGLLTASTMDECGKQAVKDMAQELEYTWDPFDGFLA